MNKSELRINLIVNVNDQNYISGIIKESKVLIRMIKKNKLYQNRNNFFLSYLCFIIFLYEMDEVMNLN